MIITNEQKQDIQHELNYAVKYQETYDELYDHVLTAIENIEGTVTFYGTTITKNMIDNDFGGYDALKQTEKDRAKLIKNAMGEKHIENIKWFLKWPTVLLSIILVLAAYFIDRNFTAHRYLLMLILATSTMPLLFLFFKKMQSKYIARSSHTYSKPSIKDGYIFTAALLACNIVNVISQSLREFDHHGTFTIFFFVLYAIYVLSFFKLYREEYRINLAR